MSLSAEELAILPPVRSDLHNGFVFGSELLSLLDSFHLPTAIIDCWNGKWVEVVWINKQHCEVLGGKSREDYLKKLNVRGENATETFEKRLQMWKNKVQVSNKERENATMYRTGGDRI